MARVGTAFRPPVTLVRVTSDLAIVDTLGIFGGLLQEFVQIGSQSKLFGVPFGPDTHWAVGSSDGTIVVGDASVPALHRFHADGSHSIVRWGSTAVPLSETELEAWLDAQRAAPWTQARLPEHERAWATVAIPDVKPHYGSLAVGSDGSVWVGQPPAVGATSSTFRVFRQDGAFEGVVTLPARFAVHDAGPGWGARCGSR